MTKYRIIGTLFKKIDILGFLFNIYYPLGQCFLKWVITALSIHNGKGRTQVMSLCATIGKEWLSVSLLK